MSDTSPRLDRDVPRLDRTAVRVLGADDRSDGAAFGAAATRLGLALTRGTRSVVATPSAGGLRRAPAPAALPPEAWYLPLLPTRDGDQAAVASTAPVALLAADRAALLAVADLALGGVGDAADDRVPSPVEAGVALRRLHLAAGPLLAAVLATRTGTPRIAVDALEAGLPTRAPLPAAAPALDTWSVQLSVPATGATGTLLVGLPVHTSGPRHRAPAAASDVLQQVPVEVVVTLPGLQLSAAEVEGLAPGDVVPFAQTADEPVPAMLAGRPVLAGVLGRSGHRLALQVTTPCATTDRETR